MQTSSTPLLQTCRNTASNVKLVYLISLPAAYFVVPLRASRHFHISYVTMSCLLLFLILLLRLHHPRAFTLFVQKRLLLTFKTVTPGFLGAAANQVLTMKVDSKNGPGIFVLNNSP
jgi:hypothetical protein